MINLGTLTPFMTCAFFIVYMIYLSISKGVPKTLLRIGIFQVAICSHFIAGIHLQRHNPYLELCETVYFSMLAIINSEFYRHSFDDVKHRTKVFIAFIQIVKTLPEEVKERIQKAYFDRFPQLELLQIQTKRITYVVELINFIIMLGALLAFISSKI